MWEKDWREQVWASLDAEWDVIVVGGGITGAGVLREACQHGLKALLLEAHDFSFGTSSRSSKLIHGGFRYLRNRQWDVTHELVREREWLLKEAPHLVERLSFYIPEFENAHTPAWEFGLGVIIYDLMAPKWQHGRLGREALIGRLPALRRQGLTGGHSYHDAEMDDLRLVLRVIREAVRGGAAALNYARVDGLLRDRQGRVRGVQVRDESGAAPRSREVRARVVINAAGPWSDELRAFVDAQPQVRRCRGSHLVFPRKLFPLDAAVTLMHPQDDRAMFAIPWEGATLIGTTDLDEGEDWQSGEPFARPEEVAYILAAMQSTFPGVEAGPGDILSSFAGLRPLIRPQGSADPSAVSRRHVVLDEFGLITITGGKLTTFRLMARAALRAARPYLPGVGDITAGVPLFDPLPSMTAAPGLTLEGLGYLLGRYGRETPELLGLAGAGELDPIASLPNVWAELRWAARLGGALHLDDMLLRRVRLGLLLPEGGLGYAGRIRALVQDEAGWDDSRWDQELIRYQEIWTRYYAPAPQGQKAMRIADNFHPAGAQELAVGKLG